MHFFLWFQVIKAAEDSTLQYMNFMNVVFAAQKKVGYLDDRLNTQIWCVVMDSGIQKMIIKFLLYPFFLQNVLIDACMLDTDSGLLQQVFFIPKL